MESVAARIRRLRVERGLTQQQLAARIGVTSVARWEKNVLPQPVHRTLLAQALGVTVDELMGASTASTQHQPSRVRERRQPVLQPLREVVGRVQSAGEDVLADFVGRVVQLATSEGWLRRGRK